MKEVLSQGEIDSLLQAMLSGEVVPDEAKQSSKEQRKLKLYDFRRPNKFTREHLRTLHVLHEGYARLLSNFLSGYLRADISIEVASVGQSTYEEFVRSIPTPTILTIFNMVPLKGTAVVETNPQFLFPLIDLQFGGVGEMPAKIRELTDIELTIARRIIVRLLEHLALTWKDITQVTAQIDSIETNPHLHQVMSPNDMVAVITLTTTVNEEVRGLINICFPFALLDPVLSKLSQTNQYSRFSESNEEDARNLEYWLKESEVEISVVTGHTNITVQEFLQLQQGDVLVLEKRCDQDFDVLVDDQLKFKSQAGVVGPYLAVQITSLAEEAWESV